MSARPGDPQHGVPALAGEDHLCGRCRMDYARVSVPDAVAELARLPEALGRAVAAVPASAHRVRPDEQTWSVTEYVCHLRDVYVAFTIRLHRACTEDGPAFDPMLNDLRARRFRYNERDVDAVLAELGAAVAGFRDEIARVGPDQWERVVRRYPGEVRTARWLVRQATHEGRHHLDDVRRTGTAAAARTPPTT